jgi:hypothetical protein
MIPDCYTHGFSRHGKCYCNLCACSVAVPGPLKENSFLISGNLTAGVRAPPAVVPAQKTAAGLAFYERRWFHISRSAVGG